MSILRTARLAIEEGSESDGSFFFQLMNSENWLQFIGDRRILTEQDAVNYIQNSLIKSYHENGFGLYKVILKANSTPIGICGFIQRDYLDSPDIGFAVLPNFEGQGLISEAAASVLAYGIDVLGLKEIFGITTENNLASRKVLTKIGMKKVRKIKPDDEELILYRKGQ